MARRVPASRGRERSPRSRPFERHYGDARARGVGCWLLLCVLSSSTDDNHDVDNYNDNDD